MPVKVKDILESLNTEAPFSLAESWDNVGLLVGNPEQEVTAVLAGLDPTNRLVDEAIAQGANTIVTHHPVIFKPLQQINTAEPGGRLLEKALANRIAIIGCHTNFDSAREGVSDYLALQLGLTKLVPLVASPGRQRIRHRTRPHRHVTPPLLTAGEFRRQSPSHPEAARRADGRNTAGKDLHSRSLRRQRFRAGTDCLSAWRRRLPLCGNKTQYGHLGGGKRFLYYRRHPLRNGKTCCRPPGQQTAERPVHEKSWNIKILQTQEEHHPFVLLDKTYKPL